MPANPANKGLRLIALVEAVKGVLGLLLGIGAALLPQRDLQRFAESIVNELRLDPAAHYTSLFIRDASLITARDLGTVAILASAYSLFRFAEAYGLWREAAWAEWLAVVSGTIYIPFELFSLSRRVTWVKCFVLGLNLLVVLYVAKMLARSGEKASEVKTGASLGLGGLHHITAIAGDPRRNVDFYTRALGLRFVKKSVNQDDPGTYHLYYGDYAGSPGTILTFFPWIGIRRGRPGTGQAYATAFSVPAGSLPFWQARLSRLKIESAPIESRFADQVLALSDPDGLRIELIATAEPDSRPPAPSADVPAENAIRGFHSTTLALVHAESTVALLTGLMNFRLAAQADHRARYAVAAGGPGAYVDVLTDPGLPPGLNGAGTVHHIAFRVPDDAAEERAHALLLAGGVQASPIIDRAYFRSVYYREPNGVLFEIATDQPGFAIDEPVETLGSRLSLPPRLESLRAEIEAALPRLT